MTQLDSIEHGEKRQRSEPGQPAPPDSGSRKLAATIAALIAGAIAFAALMLLGLLLDQRLWGSPIFVIGAITVLFAAAGLYAGWLAAMIVFSAVRGEKTNA
ncbi:MAG TPA: hypothetical protein VF134_06460 [Candidatus Dormibacteraeota bacterium]